MCLNVSDMQKKKNAFKQCWRLCATVITLPFFGSVAMHFCNTLHITVADCNTKEQTVSSKETIHFTVNTTLAQSLNFSMWQRPR